MADPERVDCSTNLSFIAELNLLDPSRIEQYRPELHDKENPRT